MPQLITSINRNVRKKRLLRMTSSFYTVGYYPSKLSLAWKSAMLLYLAAVE